MSATTDTLNALIAELRAKGVNLGIDQDELTVRAPKGVMTPELAAQLRAQKPLLLDYLRQAQQRTQASTAPIPLADKHDRQRLSDGQRRLWFLDRLEGPNSTYNMPISVRIEGDLDAMRVRQALTAIAQRHETLRTRFVSQGDQVVSVIDPDPTLDLRCQQADPAFSLAQQIDQAVCQAAQVSFALDREHAIKAWLVTLGDESHLLLLTLHHIVADGWSLANLIKEFAALYNNSDQSLEPLPIQYADYAAWQAVRHTPSQREQALRWWSGHLDQAPELITLPLDHPRPAVMQYRGKSLKVELAPELNDAVKALALRQDCTPYMVMLAAFAILLQRHAASIDSTDMVIGTTSANRPHPDLEALIGLFINMLALRLSVDPDESGVALLAQVKSVSLQSNAHQDVAFEQVVEAINPRRSLSHAPLFQVTFDVQNAPDTELTLPGLRLHPIEAAVTASKFDLGLSIESDAQGSFARWTWNPDLFEDGTIKQLTDQYPQLLSQLTAHTDWPISRLSLVDVRHQHMIVQAQKANDHPVTTTCWLTAFEQQASAFAQRSAVSDDRETLTYQVLRDRARTLAAVLRSHGVGPEDRVCVLLDRGVNLLVSMLAVQYAGAAYVPLDPSYPAQRLAWVFEDACPAAVLTEQALWDRVPAIGTARATVIAVDTPALSETDEPIDDALPLPGSSSLAYVIFTSGSTGRPKGVQVEHGALANFLMSMARTPGMGPDDKLLAVTTVSFDIAALELYLPLTVGGHVVIADRDTTLDGQALISQIKTRRITCMQATPSTWRLMLDSGWSDAKTLRVLSGGEALPKDLSARLQSIGAEVWNLYGPTETTIWSAALSLAEPRATHAVGNESIGTGIDNTQLYVLDAGGEILPMGIAGELWIGGLGLARGYLNRPGQTAERYRPDPYGDTPGARLYGTGDLVRAEKNGTLTFLGRLDGQVKLRGYRIELGDIESVLRRQVDIAQTVVLVVGDDPVERRLVAYIQAHKGVTLTSQARRIALQAELPSYMVPSQFILLDALPLTPNGKIDRKALLALEVKSTPVVTEHQTPDSPIEQQISDVWCDALKSSSIDVGTNFFDAGGHSLMLAHIHARLQQSIAPNLALVALFQYPTIRALATHIEGLATTSTFKKSSVTKGQSPSPDSAIAIIGMACRFPGAPNLDRFWQLLHSGGTGIRFFTKEELEQAGIAAADYNAASYVPAHGSIDDIECFDAPFFGYRPKQAQLIDPQQRLFLETAWHTLEHAGYAHTALNPSIGVFAGCGQNDYLIDHVLPSLQNADGVSTYEAILGAEKDFIATRVSYALNLTGPSINVQTACSTSLVAVHMACQSLLAGECEMAMAGGVALRVPQAVGHHYQAGMIASPDGHCKPFDANAEGTVWGSGSGAVLLKPLRQAMADGDTIHAVIQGSAINNDGAHKVGFTAPSVQGQASVIERALACANLTPNDIDYVETHGTATALGDLVETAALKKVWGQAPSASCALGAVKSQIGHLNSAAGIAGLIKAVLAMSHGKIPGNPGFETPHPDLSLTDSPFFVQQATSDWPIKSGLRCAGVSSFGIGGTNAHVIVQQAPMAVPALTQATNLPQTSQLLTLSAHSEGVLLQLRDACVADLAQTTLPLPEVAATLSLGRKPMPHRMAVVATTRDEAAELLRTTDPYHAPERANVAWLFPGQGSQYVGMGQSLYGRWPEFKRWIDECSQRLLPLIGHDLRDIFDSARAADADLSDKLDQTWLTQPALFTLSYAQAKLWQSWGVEPVALLGHSLGEYVAACLANVFDLPTALALVAARGQLVWQQPAGAMLAIGLSSELVRRHLGQPEFIELDMAAINGPQACVVAGPCDRIEAFATLLGNSHIACKRLKTSHAFHSHMLAPAKQAFAELVAGMTLSAPTIPVVSNVTGTWLQANEATDPDYWARHLLAPVQFAQGLQTLSDWQRTILLEVGPGQVLSNLTRQQTGASALSVASGSTDTSMLGAMAKLWRAYGTANAADCLGTEATPKARRPWVLYPFERQRHWLDAEQRQSGKPRGRQAIENWFYLPYWQPSIAPARQPCLTQTWYLDGFDQTWASEIGMHLASTHDSVFKVPVFKVPNEAQSKPLEIVQTFASSTSVGLIVAADPDSTQSTFARLLNWARAWHQQRPGQALRLIALTQPIHSVLGNETIHARQASLRGAILVVSQEFPLIETTCIDMAPGPSGMNPRVLAALDAEVCSTERLPFVSLRGTRRYVPAFEQVRLPTNHTQNGLRQNGVYLITGGLGNMGLAMARDLIKRINATVILTGRKLPSPGEARYVALHALGPQAEAHAVDVTDRADMFGLIDHIGRTHGSLNGVFHAAGLQHWQAISEDVDATEKHLLEGKLHGAQVLAEALADRPIDFCVAMSSIAAELGGLGYAYYSGANAALDAFVQQIHLHTDTNWLSINWDAWRFDSSGDPDWIDAEQGIEALMRLLGAMPCPRVVVSTTPLMDRIDQWVHGVGRTPPALPIPRGPAAPTTAVNKEPMTATQTAICQVWQSALGYPAVGLDDDYFDLGGDSMLAIRIIEMLQTQFGRSIPMTALLQYPSVRKLASVLDDKQSLTDSILVPLNSSQSHATVYLLPGTGGSVLYLNDLARELGLLGFACVGLQASGLDGEKMPHDAIEAIARENIGALMAHQPQGPYNLIGHSLGSWIAYEMARQLHSLGQQVSHVVVLDTAAPGLRENEQMRHWSNEQWLLSVADNVGRVWDTDFGISLDDLASLSWSQQIAWLHRATVDHGILPPDSQENLVRGIVQVFRTQALIQYQPEPREMSPVTLIRARDRLPEFLEGIPQALINDDAWGWQPFSQTDVQVHFVDGNHLNMVSRENAAALASQLQKYLTITDEVTP
jgi:amino acid adenylation domain-containing protein